MIPQKLKSARVILGAGGYPGYYVKAEDYRELLKIAEELDVKVNGKLSQRFRCAFASTKERELYEEVSEALARLEDLED